MTDADEYARHIVQIGLDVRAQIVQGRDILTDSAVVAREGGDTIFAIDRKVEPLIIRAISKWPAALLPALVVCEGLGADGRMWFGPKDQPLRVRVLIDPIDGTRPLMYDKRPAWFLAAVAPDHGEATSLSHAIASTMVELPTSKQALADVFRATFGGSVQAERHDLRAGTIAPLSARPSSEITLRQGFGHVVSFFPGVKRLAAELMETIAIANLGSLSILEASIFDDQYTSSGGQLVELAMGHDRFCADLRPLLYRIEGLNAVKGLACHPYDLAGLLVAKQAGVIVTDGWGNELDAPFDVNTDVAWCGYANEAIRRAIEPVIQRWLSERLRGPS